MTGTVRADRAAPTATWKVVAITLGAVMLAGLIFVAGLVTGVVMSGTDLPASGARAGSGGSTSGDPGASGSPRGAPDVFDPCLVGTWKTTSYEQRATSDQGENVLTGLVRTFTFDDSGKHVVTYAASKASMDAAGSSSSLVFDGTVAYEVSLRGSTMSFVLLSVKGSVTVVAPNGTQKKQDLKPGTGDVTYTCEGDTYSEVSSGYREVAARVR